VCAEGKNLESNNVVINCQLLHLLFQDLSANYMQYFRDSRERFGKFGLLIIFGMRGLRVNLGY